MTDLKAIRELVERLDALAESADVYDRGLCNAILEAKNDLSALLTGAEQGAEAKCPYCAAPCRLEVLPRGGDNGWGDDASRTVHRYASPALRRQIPANKKPLDRDTLLTALISTLESFQKDKV